MATKGQELKKELTQAFSGLKFSVKTKMVCKGNITEIVVTVKGLKDSDYTIAEIKEITNKYHNWDWRTVTGDTNVIVNTDEETKKEIDNPVIETVQKTKEENNNPVYEQKITRSDLKPIADEQKTENTIANQADPEYAIKSITIHWTEASNCTNKTFYSIADAITEIRSWYKNDPQYLPTGEYYNKTEVNLTFSNKVREQNYTMRLFISQTEDNPFESENLFHTHFLEFWQEITDKSDLDFFLGCNWHRMIDTLIEYPQISLVDMVMAEIAIEEKYQKWIQDKLNLGQYDQIVTLETFKSTISPPVANLVFV